MMTNPFLEYVAGFENLLATGRNLSAAALARPSLPVPSATAPVCLVFSPHPDDEAIAGALAWRLRSQCGWRVVNIAVTLGSKQARRAPRWQELTRCCNFLGFDLVSASGESVQGFAGIKPQAASLDAAYWSGCVARVAELIAQYRPRLIVCPHDHDGHPTHIGTHLLVMDALRRIGPALRLHLALSEYWTTQADPRLMVELGAQDVATLVAALSLHAGEVARNPYHLTLPAWFIDAVRRGAERVGLAGAVAPDFRFAALYGWQRWDAGTSETMPARWLPLTARASDLFD